MQRSTISTGGVSKSSHGPADRPSTKRSGVGKCPPCERILTQPPSNRSTHNIRPNQQVTVRANPHTSTDMQPPGLQPGHINRLHVSQSSHDDRHDAGWRGRRHHCHHAPTRHCAIDTPRITNEPKAQSSTLSPVLPKHNYGSSGGFPRMTRLPRNRARRTAAPDARQGRYVWERTRAPAAQPHAHHCLKFSNSCV